MSLYRGISGAGQLRRGVIVYVAAFLAACSSAWSPPPAEVARWKSSGPAINAPTSPREAAVGPIPKGGGIYKVGTPYQIAGAWYTPAEDPTYDQSGTASWYGSDFHARRTSNGEIYDMEALTAAHRTLPMPSYVYVTNLDNNRTVLLRVNDRGPYARGRIIDLSRSAANALGAVHHGTANVRVRYAGPAPLNGDSRREHQFLASQPWIRSGTAVASDAGRPANNIVPYRPAAETVQQRPAFAAAPGPAVPQGWSPDVYRAGERSGLGR